MRARWARSAAPSTSVAATDAVLEQTLVTRMQVSRAEMMRKESPGDVCGPAILHRPRADQRRDSRFAPIEILYRHIVEGVKRSTALREMLPGCPSSPA
ncbi:hypothetical protein GCM10009641_57380 [Mycobacterium cookii]|uniref:Uncharacterized protein n=1 Tax=Nocardioides furvisabuli TaxID=375542 RepID=A0ABN2X673_9ACTN